MTEQRKRCWNEDVLLDPQLHPVGVRLLLSNKSRDPKPYEVTVTEWAPSKLRVKLRFAHGGESWVECWDYDPVVIERLVEAA